jgi:hypothetical protein
MAECHAYFYNTGGYNIKATYYRYSPGQYDPYDEVPHEVNKIPTTISVTADPSPSRASEPLTLTATITPGYGGTVWEGNVTFKIDGTPIGSPVNVNDGSATKYTGYYSPLEQGTHTITAIYSGSGTYATSTSPAYSQTVNRIPITARLELYQTYNPSQYGTDIELRASVSPEMTWGVGPEGFIYFELHESSGWTQLAYEEVNSYGVAYYTIEDGPYSLTREPGTYQFRAVWHENDYFAGNTSDVLEHTVSREWTSTEVDSSKNPSVLGESINFTAIVRKNGGYPDGGTVQFRIDGVNFSAPVAINPTDGHATSGSIHTLTVGSHPVTAEYSGTSDHYANSSGYVWDWDYGEGQHVNRMPTTTNVVVPLEPIEFGKPVNIGATVAPASSGLGTPSGTVTFSMGSTILGQAPLSAGPPYNVSLLISGIPAGSHPVTATYSGDSNFEGSHGTENLVVDKAVTLTTVISNKTVSVFGEPVKFTATVTVPTQGQLVPDGTVTFRSGSTTLGTRTLNSTGGTFLEISSLSVGSHTINATYNGNSNFTGSWQTVDHTVNKAGTTTTVVSNKTPAVFGEPVRFTATVVASAPGAGTPSGTITFMDGSALLGTGTLNSTGGTSLDTSSLSVGSHTINATYSGNANFTASWQTVVQTVDRAGTMTTIVSNKTPVVFGEPVRFTATVVVSAPGAGTPSGTMTFMEGTATLGTGTLNSTGGAYLDTSSLSVGSHTINATYSGNANFTASWQTMVQMVDRAETSTAVVSNKTPTVFGEPVKFTATVTVSLPGAGTPGGTVTFRSGSTILGTGTLNSTGGTFLDTSALSAGPHSVNATYNGDANFTGSGKTIDQTVNRAATRTTVASNKTPTVFGEPVKFIATVIASPPGAGIPTGNVTFTDGTAILGTGTLNSTGGTSLEISSLSVGTHAINATYNSDLNFTGSSGTGITQVVQKASTRTSVTSSRNPSVYSQLTPTFTAKVEAVAPGFGTPSGTVTFKEGATTLGTGTLTGGSANFTPSATALSVGNHAITVIYQGDASFKTSTSPVLTQAVNAPPKVTAFVPNNGKRGAAAFKVVLSGSAFQNGATVSLTKTGVPTIEATGVSVSAQKNSITCMVAIPSGAPTGTRNVLVKNPDGGTVTVSGFTVK